MKKDIGTLSSHIQKQWILYLDCILPYRDLCLDNCTMDIILPFLNLMLVDIVLPLWNFPEVHKKFIFSCYIFGKKIPRDTIHPILKFVQSMHVVFILTILWFYFETISSHLDFHIKDMRTLSSHFIVLWIMYVGCNYYLVTAGFWCS